MASGHEKNFNRDPDRSSFSEPENRNNLNDSSPLPVENSVDNFNSNEYSQPMVSQDLQPPSHQPFGGPSNLTLLHVPRPGEIPKIPESSRQSFHDSSENVPIVIQDAKTFSGLRHGCNVEAGPHTPSGTEFSESQNQSLQQSIPSDVPNNVEFSRIQDSPQDILQHCVNENTAALKDVLNLYQPETQSRSNQKSGINSIQNCGLNSPTTEIPNQPIANQGLHSLPQTPVESETQEIKELNPLPQVVIQNNDNKPSRSFSKYRLMKKTGLSKLAGIAPGECFTISGSFPDESHFMNKKTISYDEEIGRIINVETFALSKLQRSYSNISKDINIFLYGPIECTTRFLETYTTKDPMRCAYPYNLAFKQSITRCGILMTVSIWQIFSIFQSIDFLKSSCLSSKSSIVLMSDEIMIDVKEKPQIFQTAFTMIRCEISRSVPIILVGSKISSATSANAPNSIELTKACFKLKAKYDLSAFLECSPNSKEEVENVMLTAIDVSRINF